MEIIIISISIIIFIIRVMMNKGAQVDLVTYFEWKGVYAYTVSNTFCLGRNDGSYVYPTDCTRYYICTRNQTTIQSCLAGFFDLTTNTCSQQLTGQRALDCSSTATSITPTASTTNLPTTSTPVTSSVTRTSTRQASPSSQTATTVTSGSVVLTTTSAPTPPPTTPSTLALTTESARLTTTLPTSLIRSSTSSTNPSQITTPTSPTTTSVSTAATLPSTTSEVFTLSVLTTSTPQTTATLTSTVLTPSTTAAPPTSSTVTGAEFSKTTSESVPASDTSSTSTPTTPTTTTSVSTSPVTNTPSPERSPTSSTVSATSSTTAGTTRKPTASVIPNPSITTQTSEIATPSSVGTMTDPTIKVFGSSTTEIAQPANDTFCVNRTDSFYVYPTDCTKYYICTSNQTTIQTCFVGLFDPTTDSCVQQLMGQRALDCGQTPISRTTLTPSVPVIASTLTSAITTTTPTTSTSSTFPVSSSVTSSTGALSLTSTPSQPTSTVSSSTTATIPEITRKTTDTTTITVTITSSLAARPTTTATTLPISSIATSQSEAPILSATAAITTNTETSSRSTFSATTPVVSTFSVPASLASTDTETHTTSITLTSEFVPSTFTFSTQTPSTTIVSPRTSSAHATQTITAPASSTTQMATPSSTSTTPASALSEALDTSSTEIRSINSDTSTGSTSPTTTQRVPTVSSPTVPTTTSTSIGFIPSAGATTESTLPRPTASTSTTSPITSTSTGAASPTTITEVLSPSIVPSTPLSTTPTTTTSFRTSPSTSTASVMSTSAPSPQPPSTTSSSVAASTTPTPTTSMLRSPSTTTPPSTSTTAGTTTTARTTTNFIFTGTSATLKTPTGCSNPVDVVFLLDSSSSIDDLNWALLKAFIQSVVNSFDTEGGAVQVGLALFSEDVQPAFNLSQYRTRSAIQTSVSAATRVSGTTDTTAAISYARTVMFSSEAGARFSVSRVIVLLTDGGGLSGEQSVIQEAALAKKDLISIIVVTIGTWFNQFVMNNVASYPSASTWVKVDNPSTLLDYTQRVLSLVCNNVDDCSSNPCRVAPCFDGIAFYSCRCSTRTSGRSCERASVRQVDLVVAIAGATRVGSQNFQMELDITRELVYGINSNVDSRFGMLVYSDDATVQFYLNTFTTQYDILSALSVYYPGGGTNLSAAIAAIRTKMFTPSGGHRSNVAKVAVLFIDGQSQNESDVIREAILARQAGITLLVVGISATNTQLREWLGVASFPPTFNVFNVPTYTALPTIIGRLISSINTEPGIYCISSPCQHNGTCVGVVNGYQCICTSSYTGVNCERADSGNTDMYILLDSSGRMRNERFPLVINFISSLVSGMDIGPGRTQVAVITFNNTAQVRFDLNTFSTTHDVTAAISRITFQGGLTNISSALAATLSRMSPVHGNRAGVPDMVLLVSSGTTDLDAQMTISNAISLRQLGVYVIVLSIGSNVNEYMLQAVASQPTNQTITHAGSSASLQPGLLNGIYSSMRINGSICANSPCQHGGTCVPGHVGYTCQCTFDWTGEQCQRKCGSVSLDVAIVIDMSSDDFNLIYSMSLPFIRYVVSGLPVRPDRTRIAFISAVTTPTVQFYFNTYSNASDVTEALSVWATSGRPCVPAAIQSINETVFTPTRGARRGSSTPVPSVVIVVSDADSPFNYSSWIDAGVTARRAGLDVYAIGIGDAPAYDAMASIAGNRTGHVFRVNEPDDVAPLADQLLTTLCQL